MEAFFKKKTLKIKNRIIEIDGPQVMGILNLTPDSFYDGNKYQDIKGMIDQVKKMLDHGASMIDVGGYSSRPGAKDIPEDIELKRVIQPIREIRSAFPDSIISIDTFRSKVAEKAVEAGANIINDISAGDDDPGMIDLVKSLDVPYIIMHKQGTPVDMQINPVYEQVVRDVIRYFSEKVDQLHSKEISDIIIDPGFGFGKLPEHNYQLLKHLRAFETFGLPILVGLSRKSMINRVLGIKPEEALNGTTVLNTLSLLNGADILRVHDVREAKEIIKLLTLYFQTR